MNTTTKTAAKPATRIILMHRLDYGIDPNAQYERRNSNPLTPRGLLDAICEYHDYCQYAEERWGGIGAGNIYLQIGDKIVSTDDMHDITEDLLHHPEDRRPTKTARAAAYLELVARYA